MMIFGGQNLETCCGYCMEKEKNDILRVSDNPTRLTLMEKAVFLYALLNSDGDFLIPFTNSISINFEKESFTHIQVGELIPEVIDEILENMRGSVYTSDDREQQEKLKDAKNKILENIKNNVHTKGSGSRREQTVVPRLEWLVDLGFFKKPEPDKVTRKYLYGCTQKRMLLMSYTCVIERQLNQGIQKKQ